MARNPAGRLLVTDAFTHTRAGLPGVVLPKRFDNTVFWIAAN